MARDFILSALRIIFSKTLVGLGSSIALAGVAALTSFLQTLIMAIAASAGYRISLPDAPIWLGCLLLFLGISIAVLGGYWQSQATHLAPNLHDIELLKRFRNEFTDSRVEYLRSVSFQNTFNNKALDCVTEIGNWRGARFEFVDTIVENVFKDVKIRASELDNLIGLKTWHVRKNPNLGTALHDNFDEWNPDAQTLENIRLLNQAARHLIESIDQFERIARAKVPY